MTIHFFFLVRQQCVFLLLHRESLMRVFSEWFQLNDFLASGVGQFYILISKNIVLAPASVFIFCYTVDVLWHFGSEKVNSTVSFSFCFLSAAVFPQKMTGITTVLFIWLICWSFKSFQRPEKLPTNTQRQMWTKRDKNCCDTFSKAVQPWGGFIRPHW